MNINVSLSGDSIISKKISVCREENFLKLIDVIREADVAYTHLETNILNYSDPEVYPAAEAGWTWMRSPIFLADELKWAGFDIVSHASNHSLDYSYGGLYSTWKALQEAGLPYAGTGMNLGEARAPAYLDTDKARVALVSMTSSFTRWARAGEARADMKGRPGVNTLRYYFKADQESIEKIKELAFKMNWWITKTGQEWLLNPPGIHNTVFRYQESDEPGMSAVAYEEDVRGNLRSIEEARRQADLVMVHIHNHEWDPNADLSVPPQFVVDFAHSCIDEGADIFIAEGSHSLLRGIEIYKGKPIFYDPGDLFRTGINIERLPADYYYRPGYKPEVRSPEATTTDAFEARKSLPSPINPKGGYFTAPVLGLVLPVCTFNERMELSEIKLYPAIHLDSPISRKGFPALVYDDMARRIIDYLGELSKPFGTKVDFNKEIGKVVL